MRVFQDEHVSVPVEPGRGGRRFVMGGSRGHRFHSVLGQPHGWEGPGAKDKLVAYDGGGDLLLLAGIDHPVA